MPTDVITHLRTAVASLKRQIQAPPTMQASAQLRNAMQQLFAAYDAAVQEELQGYEAAVSCDAGCSACCFHWVDDVYWFEALVIAEYIRTYFPEHISRIVAQCLADEQALMHIQSTIDGADEFQSMLGQFDEADVVLASFYQLRRPCPLLSPDGRCMVYAVRPLSCRSWVSFSDPHHCEPEQIHEKSPNLMVLPDQHCDDVLDELHQVTAANEGDSGLRSQLSYYLTLDSSSSSEKTSH